MNKTIAFLLVLSLFHFPAEAQQQPPPGKIIIQTPFGPKIIDAPAADQTPAAPAPAPPAAPQTPVPPPQVSPDDNSPFAINGENLDIYAVIRIFAGYLNINYIIDPQVRGTVNINAGTNLRRSDLMPILETILKTNGATMVKNGNIYQIVPSSTIARQPLQVQDGTQLPPAPDDQMVMQIIRMKYASATEMATLLGPYAGEGANITAHEAGNILLITERRSNLRKLLEIVDIFDTNVFEGERVRLFPVQNSLARELIGDLQNVFNGYALSKTTGAIKFTVIERMNSILAIAPNQSVFPEIEKWLARLDDRALTSGRRTYVYKVKNSNADAIQKVLIQVFSAGLQMSSVYSLPSGAAANAGAPQPNAPATPAANPFSAGSPTQVVPGPATGSIRIIADTNNNALVIQATAQEYAEIERTIQELDILPRQVLIDAQVFEVSLDDSIAFGLSATLQARGTLAHETTASFASGTSGPPAFNAATFALVGRTRELLVFLNAQENRSRVRTLSAPSVVVSDNMTANFTVGADIPIPTTTSALPVQTGGTTQFSQTVEFRSTGVILKVKPQINDSGNVTLEISQEVSQAGANTVSAVVAPVIGKASVSSNVVVQDSQTIAIGGFIRENNELARNRIPLLGRLPIAGGLFGSTRRSTGRSELVILITPHVLRTHSDADAATDELKAKLKEIQKLLK